MSRKVLAAIVLGAIAFLAMVAPVAAKSKHHHPSIEVAWCSLKIGQPTSDARAKLGKPSKLASQIKAIVADTEGTTALEWNKGGDVFLVTIGGHGIAKLQAYGSLKTFAPATNIACNAFRDG
jgi:hypothetical protein